MAPHLPHAPKSLRIALLVVARMDAGDTIAQALDNVSTGLGINKGTVASCVLRWRSDADLNDTDIATLMKVGS